MCYSCGDPYSETGSVPWEVITWKSCPLAACEQPAPGRTLHTCALGQNHPFWAALVSLLTEDRPSAPTFVAMGLVTAQLLCCPLETLAFSPGKVFCRGRESTLTGDRQPKLAAKQQFQLSCLAHVSQSTPFKTFTRLSDFDCPLHPSSFTALCGLKGNSDGTFSADAVYPRAGTQTTWCACYVCLFCWYPEKVLGSLFPALWMLPPWLCSAYSVQEM